MVSHRISLSSLDLTERIFRIVFDTPDRVLTGFMGETSLGKAHALPCGHIRRNLFPGHHSQYRYFGSCFEETIASTDVALSILRLISSAL